MCILSSLSQRTVANFLHVLGNTIGSPFRERVPATHGLTTEYIFLLEMKQGQCICQLSWSVHCNFTGDGKCSKGVGVHPPPSPAWANFTLMIECTPESDCCYSVYPVGPTTEIVVYAPAERAEKLLLFPLHPVLLCGVAGL